MPDFTDPLHQPSGPDARWTTVNTAEAIPGVPSPLGWTFWNEPLERAMRGAFCDIGVLRPDQVRVAARPDQRYSAIFFGRFTANVDQMRAMGDLMPGTSADAIEEQILGGVASGASSAPSRRRYAAVAVKMPGCAVGVPRRLRALRADVDGWWRRSVMEPGDPLGALVEANRRFEEVMRPHSVVTMLAQALYDQVTKLCTAAGRPDLPTRLMTGYGQMEETALMRDLWAVSRDRMTLAAFLDAHGYHGPAEGEISSRSWREDPAPLQRLLDTYRKMDETAGPSSVEVDRVAQRESATAELVAALPRWRRPGARVLLGAAQRYIPLREVGKTAFLQILDVARRSGRAAGAALAERGVLGDPEDAFYLTMAELTGAGPSGAGLAGSGGSGAGDLAGANELVAFRRERRAEYQALRVPDTWTGVVTPIPAADDAGAGCPGAGGTLSGLGVSPGVAEGAARVVLDPLDGDPLEPGEILVCATTDPSWTSLFLVAAGLVIDIGGALSHGAIVARELGVPCVINTRTGTRALRTGDRLRVDGDAGTVTIVGQAR